MKHNHLIGLLMLHKHKIEFRYNKTDNLCFVEIPDDAYSVSSSAGNMISFYIRRVETFNQLLRHGHDIDDYIFDVSVGESTREEPNGFHRIDWEYVRKPQSELDAPELFKMPGGKFFRKVDNGFIELKMTPTDTKIVDDIFGKVWDA